MRARREFETSTALTVRLDRKISNRSGSPYGAKRRSAHGEAPLRDIRTGAASISFEQFKNQHHTEPIHTVLFKARSWAIHVSRYATIEYK
jgi:hypothetical protein